MMRTIGTCSLCRGAVQVPSIWHGTVPPEPKCSSCGARPRAPHGPVVEMEPQSRPRLDNALVDLGEAANIPIWDVALRRFM